MPSVGRLIGQRLREAGVKYVMGHPGGEITDLIDGFCQEGLEFILTRHETAAVFMAEAVGHYSGIPGIAIATLSWTFTAFLPLSPSGRPASLRRTPTG